MILRPHTFVSWVFLRVLGLVYTLAFASLAFQIPGLLGHNGILPAADFLNAVHARVGDDAYFRLPTLFWINCSDQMLTTSVYAGVVLSLLLMLNTAPMFCLIGLWALYLSFVNISQQFLAYQWDSLLLESGLLAVFIAPRQISPQLVTQNSSSPYAILVFRWLVFRLMFASGAVKLLSNDPSWWSLTALQYHYETQPIPNFIAYYAHQFPAYFHKFCTGALFFIELGLPMLIFTRYRMFAFFGLVLLQCIILLTGNYAFFNILTITLCILLLDDFQLAPLLPARFHKRLSYESYREPWSARRVLQHALLFCVFVLGTDQILLQMSSRAFEWKNPWQDPLMTVREWADRTRSFNNYGLFAVMTTARPEIVIEGSDDGTTWKPYEFYFKPGDLNSPPRQVAPYQPRLDWQMWFAALGTVRSNPWFLAFVQRLLEGKPEVLALLKTNPFPTTPPHSIRAVLYQYNFTTQQEHRDTGAWWKRKELGMYLPPVSLKHH